MFLAAGPQSPRLVINHPRMWNKLIHSYVVEAVRPTWATLRETQSSRLATIKVSNQPAKLQRLTRIWKTLNIPCVAVKLSTQQSAKGADHDQTVQMQKLIGTYDFHICHKWFFFLSWIVNISLHFSFIALFKHLAMQKTKNSKSDEYSMVCQNLKISPKSKIA